jgi:hypothetical protein
LGRNDWEEKWKGMGRREGRRRGEEGEKIRSEEYKGREE